MHFKKIVSTSLLKLPICSCMLCTFSTRSINVLATVVLMFLSDNPHSGVISESCLLMAVSLGNGSVFLLFVCLKFLKKLNARHCVKKNSRDGGINDIHAWKWVHLFSVRL